MRNEAHRLGDGLGLPGWGLRASGGCAGCVDARSGANE